jgi:hypothetical protein
MPHPILKSIHEAMQTAFGDLRDALRDELEKQGHRLTGKLAESIVFEIRVDGDKVVGVFLGESYGLVLETGVSASRIPYGGKTGKGGTSKYIQGLVRFFELKGLGQKQALRAAFAVATRAKREGMPSRGSFKFTRNGRRKNWITHTLNTKLPAVGAAIALAVGLDIRLEVSEALRLEPLQVPI